MKFPLPADLAWQIQLVFYVLLVVITGLGSLITFFIVRYIKKNDKSHEDLETTINGHGTLLNDHETKMSRLSGEMKDTAVKINEAATKMQTSNFKFQHGIMRDLHDMHKSTTKIKTDLTECNVKVGSIGRQVDEITDTLDKHQKTLSLSAQVMVKQKDRLKKVETKIEEHGHLLKRGKETH